jgi:transcriptional regulator with XRE-family HTH domain
MAKLSRSRQRNRTRLRVLRAEHRISQIDLAREIGIGPYRCWQIENGYAEPTPDERAAFAKFFEVTESDVFPPKDDSVTTKPRQRASAAR